MRVIVHAVQQIVVEGRPLAVDVVRALAHHAAGAQILPRSILRHAGGELHQVAVVHVLQRKGLDHVVGDDLLPSGWSRSRASAGSIPPSPSRSLPRVIVRLTLWLVPTCRCTFSVIASLKPSIDATTRYTPACNAGTTYSPALSVTRLMETLVSTLVTVTVRADQHRAGGVRDPSDQRGRLKLGVGTSGAQNEEHQCQGEQVS